MTKFCDICANLLIEQFIENTLSFQCQTCGKKQPANNEDTLRRTRMKENNVAVFDKIIKNAARDPATIKAEVPCIKCDSTIVKQVRTFPDMTLYNICVKCNTSWLNRKK